MNRRAGAQPGARKLAWCFPKSLSREQATSLLLRAGNTAGLFLLRSKDTAAAGNVIALSVVERPGEVFHHLLEHPAQAEPVILNGKPIATCTTLNETIALLSSARPQLNWPVGLTRFLSTESMTPVRWVGIHDRW